ncbi:MAG: MarR family transcriptional regulator [Dehalococcoidia bacterium]
MNKEQHFVEEVGLFFEQRGVPRMAGRVLGWLLICEPPHQSADDLAEALLASKGSISTATRLLIRLGMIVRTSLPGQRRDYFVIRPDSWNWAMHEALTKVTEFRSLAEQGLELLDGKDPEVRQRLEDMRAVYTFFEREWGALVEQWERERSS